MTLDSRSRWIALWVLCLGDLMIVLDGTIVNVALPSIRDDLGFSETSLAWVVNAYLLTFGGFLLLGGRLGDLFGHRRMFLIGIVLFTAASLVCGLSTSQGMLVASRAVQGARRRARRRRGALARDDALHRAGRARQGDGDLRVRRSRAAGSRRARGRHPHRPALLALDLLHQHPRRGRRLHPLAPPPSRRAALASGRLDVAGAISITASLMLAVYAIVNGNSNGWTSVETLGLLGAPPSSCSSSS